MLPQIIVGLVALERLIELAIARRNTRMLLAAGGVEHGAAHYPWLVLLHAAWLACLAAAVPADAPISIFWLAVFAVLQMLRLWVIVTLGRFWTTRIVTLPGAPLVRRGPYRFVSHPNYLVVAGEIAVLPLAFGEIWIAVVFSLLNALALGWRITIENRALAPRRPLSPAEN